MKKSVKIALVVAACLVGVGILVLLAAAACIKFNFGIAFSHVGAGQTRTHESSNDFENVVIDVVESDVRVLRSSNGEFQVVCKESDRVYHEVYVEDGILCVTRTDTRRWFERFGFYEMSVIVYLPDECYGSIEASSNSGDVCVGEGLAFSSAQIKSTSGDVSFGAKTDGSVSLKTTSGEIEMRGCDVGTLVIESTSGSAEASRVNVGDRAEIKTTSGNVGLSDVTAAELFAKSNSGEVELKNVIVSQNLEIKTTSGDIDMEDSDAYSLYIESTSGHVVGTLLSGKTYSVDTISGSVRVPSSTVGAGECRIRTNSGDVKISDR